MHALIIEDELLIAFALEEILQELGFDSVDIADSEATAMEAASRNRPDSLRRILSCALGVAPAR